MNNESINEHYTEDHDRLDDLFHEFQVLKSSDRARAVHHFQEFKAGLERHIAWEEEILFPSFEKRFGHFGGPIWAKRDAGAWAIPKGLVEPGEDLEACARREFEEELGVKPEGVLTPLGRIRQKGGKWVEAFALEGDLDADAVTSNDFEMEWPLRSGKFERFPEAEKARWMNLDEARTMMLTSQLPLLDALQEKLAAG